MKLVPVNDPRPGQTIQCSRCFRMMPADQMQADLEGPAFKAYYCRSCVWLAEGVRRSLGEAISANYLPLPVSHDDLTGVFVALYLLGEDHNLVGERVWWVAMGEAGVLR